MIAKSGIPERRLESADNAANHTPYGTNFMNIKIQLPTNFFSLRRIGVRLALSYALLLSLFIIVIALTVGQIHKMAKLSEQFERNEIGRLLNVQAVSLSIEGASNALLKLLTADKEQRIPEYAEVDERNRQIGRLITTLSMTLEDDAQKQTLQRLIARRSQYQDAFIVTVDQLEDEGQEAARRTFVAKVQPALTALLMESTALQNQERESIEAHHAKAQDDLNRTSLVVLSLSLLAVGMAALLAWRTTRSVVRPLARLEASALQFAAGDYVSKFPSSRTEEVERVGQALNAMVSAIASREREIEHLAFYDALTNLPNRTLLLKEHGTQALAQHGLILMDVARLKTVNETLGFDTGDTVISEAARRINDVMQAEKECRDFFLARLPGGTFAMLFSAANKDAIEHLRHRIDQAMVDPIRCGQHTVDVNLVYGIADASAVALPATTLLRNAEVALYAAKRGGLSTVWYSDAREASRLSHLSLLSDLRSAVKSSELQMWLQPKINLSTMQGYGFEALVRWQHPQRGFISPADFIPFAERTGYISMITEWMLENALRTLVSWKNTHPDFSIAVNVSTHDLRDPQFAQRVKQLLEQYQIDPKLLKLEITESGIMEDPATVITLLHSLRETGIELSIDDFGTGYSSLSYLQRLPVSELKIDRSFVIDINLHPATQRLVKTVIELGHGLDLSVIAEGIETQAERDTLTELGCDAMQGYFVSKPLHGQQLQAWLDKVSI
jgi:diguanylate cyclase (GGDEF)-like protein